MKIIAGVDEVGRGSLIGPVYAAAVILDKTIDKKLLKDSKKLTKNKREILSNYVKKNSTWAVGKASVKEIEKINILHASLLAMERAFCPSLLVTLGFLFFNIHSTKQLSSFLIESLFGYEYVSLFIFGAIFFLAFNACISKILSKKSRE